MQRRTFRVWSFRAYGFRAREESRQCSGARSGALGTTVVSTQCRHTRGVRATVDVT